MTTKKTSTAIVALRNEKGSYNPVAAPRLTQNIVALRNEKGSYNRAKRTSIA